MQLTIYHNPNCGTSRNTLAAIRSAGHEPKIVEYLKTPLPREGLEALIAQTGLSAQDIIRTNEPLYAELGLGERGVVVDELVDAMVEHPILINRPIVVLQRDGVATARLCRPSETVMTLLEQTSP